MLFQGEQIVKAHSCPGGRSNPIFFLFLMLVVGAQVHLVIQHKSVQMDFPEGIV